VYAESAEAGVRRQVDGVISVESTPVVRRLPLPGPATFARGLRVELGCDEHAFEGSGTFLLGSLLDRFFSGYASINCFVQTALSTRQRERVVEWPLRLGVRPAL
jgi:type VI secretion system protein ImpG